MLAQLLGWSGATVLAGCRTRASTLEERDPAPTPGPTAADPARLMRGPIEAERSDPLERRAAELRARWDERGLFVVVEAPFVVVGDEPPADVRRHAVHTIRWAVQRLRAQYFARDPETIIDVWLFGSDESYVAWAKELFDEEPSTPYGYYSGEHHALVMNIATGGGTLVHEIVHPYMAANFPACPSWFDEGLASLYEQSSERDGKIVGLTNWRLPALQQAIRARDVPSTRELMRTGDRPFYDRDPGTNYAQARYLCYWLQERGLLEDFYHAFVAAADDDPTGYATLSHVVDTDMDRFDAAWRKFVLALRYV